MTANEFVTHVESLASCCLKDKLPFELDQVDDAVFACEVCSCGTTDDCGSYCDRTGVAMARLADGRFAVVLDDQDTSGHGCQCGASATVHATLEDALAFGLTDEWRARYVKANPAPRVVPVPEIPTRRKRWIET